MLLAKLLLLPLAFASTISIYSQDVSSDQSPASIARIDYDATTSTASITTFKAPTGDHSAQNLVRVGLYDSSTKEWKGVVTSAASFTDEYKKKFILHVDEKGEVYHVGFGTSGRGRIQNKDDQVEVKVEIAQRTKGPQPALNKPIVLNAEGKLDNKEPEKTFLQKYWWAILLFLAFQVLSGGKE